MKTLVKIIFSIFILGMILIAAIEIPVNSMSKKLVVLETIVE